MNRLTEVGIRDCENKERAGTGNKTEADHRRNKFCKQQVIRFRIVIVSILFIYKLFTKQFASSFVSLSAWYVFCGFNQVCVKMKRNYDINKTAFWLYLIRHCYCY